MKWLTVILILLIPSIGLANPIDTTDNWQIYLNNKLLLKSDANTLFYKMPNPYALIRIKNQSNLKIFFNGCYRGISYRVEALDQYGNRIGYFELSEENHSNYLPLIIPTNFLKKYKGESIKFYQIETSIEKRKYLLISLDLK